MLRFRLHRFRRGSAIIVLAVLGAAVAAGISPVQAQYYPPPPPGYYPPPPPGYYPPPRDYDYRPCPPGYTVQGGACRPYQGPEGGGYRTWNGCPRGYTVQGGECRPYHGY
jgi:hypothetical protein